MQDNIARPPSSDHVLILLLASLTRPFEVQRSSEESPLSEESARPFCPLVCVLLHLVHPNTIKGRKSRVSFAPSLRGVRRTASMCLARFQNGTGCLFFLWTAARSAAALFFRPRAWSGFRQGCKGDCPRKAAAERAAVHTSAKQIRRRTTKQSQPFPCGASAGLLRRFAPRNDGKGRALDVQLEFDPPIVLSCT